MITNKTAKVIPPSNGHAAFTREIQLPVLNEATQLVIDNFVTGVLADLGKRTFLFTGNYGNGKTEVAMQVGRIAVREHNMSFFYVKDASVFEQLLVQSKKYQPAIIFLEDIDEIGSGEQRDARMNSILNTLDGVQTKGNNLITIFTTNHPKRINSAMRRPGRIDLVVQFENPDKVATKKIMQTYFGSIEGSDKLDYDKLAAAMPNAQGAVIAEICKRGVKLASRSNHIDDGMVLACIESIKFQIELMDETPDAVNEYQKFFEKLAEFSGQKRIAEQVEYIYENN